jgi:hypothetical protein
MAADPDILAVIARLPWRTARPQPWGLHEYTVRTPASEADFVALFETIMRDGVFERWVGRRKRYLHPGDGRKYWAMTTAVWHSRVLNRMLIADDIDRLRREGQIPPQ